MKLIHYGIIIGGIITGILFYLLIRTDDLSKELMIRKEYEHALDSAVDSAMSQAFLSHGIAEEADKTRIVNVFFEAWYDQIKLSYDHEVRTRNQAYVPCMVLSERDGVSIYSLQKVSTSKYCGAWLPKITYTFQYESPLFSSYYFICVTQDYHMTIQCIVPAFGHEYVLYEISGDYHSVKGMVDGGIDLIIKNADFLANETAFRAKIDALIYDTLMEQITYSIIEHKKNAEQAYDIRIDFAIPQISESEWHKVAHNTSLLVLYQGYPDKNSNLYIEDYSFSTQ